MYKHLSKEVLSNLDQVDTELGSQLMNLFLSELPSHKSKIDQLRNEQTSVDFGKAIHALKGSIAVFGCAEICQQLKEAEILAKSHHFQKAAEVYSNSNLLISELVNEIDTYLQQKAA